MPLILEQWVVFYDLHPVPGSLQQSLAVGFKFVRMSFHDQPGPTLLKHLARAAQDLKLRPVNIYLQEVWGIETPGEDQMVQGLPFFLLVDGLAEEQFNRLDSG